MKIALIAAHALNLTIGRSNTLPWRLPADLQRFRALTLQHACIQGRKTYESIGKPLPNRLNIIVSRDKTYKAEGCLVAHSLESAIQVAKDKVQELGLKDDIIFICGGSQLYSEALPIADLLFLTKVEAEVDGDAFFPTFETADWEVVKEEKRLKDEKNCYDMVFLDYVRRK